MSKIFYISDLHFGHDRVIEMENRPFKDMEDMIHKMTKWWNDEVTNEDIVYILGDMFYGSKLDYKAIITSLNGRKVLIKGNHDNWLTSELEELFEEVTDYKIIIDNNRRVVLFHYPILDWAYKYHGSIHLHGHIHNGTNNEEYFILKSLKNMTNIFNISCEVLDYKPRQLSYIKGM